MNDRRIDWSYFYFLTVCIESFVFVSVVFILVVVVVVFLRSRRNKKEDHVMPEEVNGEKYILSFFFSRDEIYECSCKERFLTAVNDRWIGNVISTQKFPQNIYLL